jgi:osmotically-inducible protein OsmY
MQLCIGGWRGNIMNRAMILIGIGIGAGLMYALDPQQGNRRRALARDKFTKAVHKTGHAVGATSRDVANRATGVAASVQSRFFEDNAPDDVVEARVRARLGRISSHPGAIDVTAKDGLITVHGPVFKSEMASVLRGVSSVRGVQHVENRLEPHEPNERVPGLQGGTMRLTARTGWSPTAKLAVGLTGAVLTAVALFRRDKPGMVLGGIGLALVTRAISDVGMEQFGDLIAREQPEDQAVSIPVRIGPNQDAPRTPRPPGMSDRIH